MTGKIITISRQFGSGGRTIGKLAAEKLGLRCYDREIISRIAMDSGLAEDYVSEASEHTEQGGLFATLGEADYMGSSNRLTIWSTQCKVLKEIAAKGPCIIVGRCADYVLRDEYDLLKVFLYADADVRAERIVNEYGESDVNPKKRLKDKDKRRKAYYEIYTDQRYGDPLNYDLCLNTGTFGIEGCADLIADLYEKQLKK